MSALAVVGAVVMVGALGYLGFRVLESASGPGGAGRGRRALGLLGLVAVTGAAAIALAAADLGALVLGAARALGWTPDYPAGALFVSLAYALLVPVPVVVALLGSLRVRTRRGEVEEPRRAAARLYGTVLLVLAFLALAWHGIAALIEASVGLPAIALGLPGAAVALLAARPWFARLTGGARDPDPAEAERIERCCERAGFAPAGVHVFVPNGGDYAAVSAVGLATRRHLFVSTTALERFDDGALAALLAVEAARDEGFHEEFKVLAVGGLLVGPVAALAGVAPLWVGYLAGALLPVALYAGYRLHYRFDERAARGAGRAPLVDALRTARERNYVTGNRLTGFVKMRPPLDRRVARLEANAADDDALAAEPSDDAPAAGPPNDAAEPSDDTEFAADAEAEPTDGEAGEAST